jgi:DCN1-like protein 1/2
MNARETPPAATAGPTSTELEKLFNKYKGVHYFLRQPTKSNFTHPIISSLDRADDDITVDGTLDLCSDLGVDPEDVVLLAVACELQSPSVGRWKKASWVQGWRGLG